MRCWMSTFIFVSAEKRYIKMQDKGKGIAQLVGEHATETLITGAGAHSGMAQLKSTSAKFVNQQADPSCYILFICKRQLIYVRETDVNKFNTDVPRSSVSVNSAVDSGLQYLRSSSIGSSALMKLKMIYPWFGLREGRGSIINQNQALKEVTMNSLNNLTERWQRLQMQNERHMKSGSIIKKIPLNFVEGSNDELYEQLDRVTAEAANAKREAYEEQINCQKAEKLQLMPLAELKHLRRI
ncbi:putative U-box domain-containing protein 55 isoform X2 [Eucalyptus grandis]|uniref:putative U-box domain-containing protein 55 isoform X2 n=1 Tax=Eucalyptus grandis TaxID=71139 RepID=UPI00192EC840|nr:putative U-box domain-containing protein 55 isoform X2 [Eucalyptus grandis]